MGFKSDREFLRNISIGAVGTRRLARILDEGGFRIIELERYSGSNKIWATKIKRLRVPDLLCLRSGIRIESRAKSSLVVRMSHAVNNEARAWDSGLRDDDLVGFILCRNDGDHWRASDRVALFRVKDMRASAQLAGLSPRKAASEGSELQLEWKATIPKQAGEVQEVTQEKITTLLDSGRKQSYKLGPKKAEGGEYYLTPYVQGGERFGVGDTILASAIPELVPPVLGRCTQYDFIPDLESGDRESVYAAAKALGHLPEIAEQSQRPLLRVVESHENDLLRLEASAALARLNVQEGWDFVSTICDSDDFPIDVKMEAVLILSEMRCQQSLDLLKQVTSKAGNESEYRAAAVWGLSQVANEIGESDLLEAMADPDELVAAHAIAGSTRVIDAENVAELLDRIGSDDRESAGIVRAVIAANLNCVAPVVEKLSVSTGRQRMWLLYPLACKGRSECEAYLREHNAKLLNELEFFWTFHVENWTNRLDVADQIDFLLEQILK